MALAPVRPALKALLIAAFWLVFAAAYFDQWALPQSGLILSSVLWFAAVLFAANGYGDALAQRALPADASALELVCFSVGAGFGILSFLMTLLGVFGAWHFSGALIIVTAGLLLQARAFSGRWVRRLSVREAPLLPTLLIVAGLTITTLFALSPVTYYDSLVYHLAMPAAYVQAHRWVPMTELIYSAFPQNLEMLWTLALLLHNDTVANLIGCALGGTLLLSVFAFAARYLREDTGWRAAALLCAMPAFMLLGPGGYVDIGLAAFTFLSLYALFLWRDGGNDWCLFAAGAFAGWAVGVKYTGGISAAIGIVYLAAAERPFKLATFIRAAAIYSLAAAFVFLPWAVKNYVYVGNPVFPFFRQWGIAAHNPWVGQAAEGYFRGLVEYESRSPLDLVNVLWRVATKGLDFGRGMDVLGDFGWAPLVGFLPALWLCGRSTTTRWLLAYAALFFVPWGMTRPVLRFMFPLAPIFAILSGHAWGELADLPVGWFRRLGQALALGLLISNLFILGFVAVDLGLLNVPFGFQERRVYLGQKLSYYNAAEFINREASVKEVLVVGDQRGYYYNKPALVTPVFNRNPLVDWAETASSPEALRDLIRSKGVTHLLINHKEMARLAPYNILPFSEPAAERWEAVRARLAHRIYADTACEVLAL